MKHWKISLISFLLCGSQVWARAFPPVPIHPDAKDVLINSPKAINGWPYDAVMGADGNFVVAYDSMFLGPPSSMAAGTVPGNAGARAVARGARPTGSGPLPGPVDVRTNNTSSNGEQAGSRIREMVLLRPFDKDGAPLNKGVRLPAPQRGFWVLDPVMAGNGTGNFVVAWETHGSLDKSNQVLQGQLLGQIYDFNAKRVGATFPITPMATGYVEFPSVAMAPSGDFMVVWSERVDPYGTTSDESILWGQRFDPTGAAVGVPFRISDSDPAFHPFSWVQVQAAPDGSFIVVQDRSDDDSGVACDAYARRFNSDGTPGGAEFRVSNPDLIQNLSPNLAINSAGEFIISWSGYNTKVSNGVSADIYAQIFDADGQALGQPILMNVKDGDYQSGRAIADSDGDFLVSFYGASLDAKVPPGYVPDVASDILLRKVSPTGQTLSGLWSKAAKWRKGWQGVPILISNGSDRLGAFWQYFPLPGAKENAGAFGRLFLTR